MRAARPLSSLTPNFSLLIIGGGITGLSTAWYLEKAASENGLDLSIVMVEREDCLGGKIRTLNEDGFTIEAGPDGFLTRKPWALALANELGLEGDVVYTRSTGASLLSNGRLHDIPRGLMGPAPASWRDVWSASFLSWRGKLRASLEPLVKRRRPGEQAKGRESLGHFLKRRLGADLTDTLLEPLTAGIYGGNSYDMSLDALFPMLEQWEKRYGSITRGMREARKSASAAAHTRAQPPSAFFSLSDGASRIISAMASRLEMTEMVLGRAAVAVEPAQDRRYRVSLDDGRVLESDAVVLANPAWDAGRLVASFAPGLAGRLRRMRSSAAGSVYLAFRRDSVSHPLDGTGFLVPRSEWRGERKERGGGSHSSLLIPHSSLVTGCTWMSSKWTDRSPADYVLLRAFLGGADDDSFLSYDDSELVETATETLRPILGIHGTPERSWVFRWQEGMPQYKVDHTDWRAGLDSELASHPGLFLCGSSYRGIGVPDCVRQGRDTAERILEFALRLPESKASQTAKV